jgi:hypothetical protein
MIAVAQMKIAMLAPNTTKQRQNVVKTGASTCCIVYMYETVEIA